jgi:RNA polymerase sigma-70 factor (ECF subfamily)
VQEWSSQVSDHSLLEEHTRAMNEALKSLPNGQREIILLAYFRGLSLRQIADRQGETLVNVRNHYYRGLKRLRKLMTDLVAENGK